MAVKAKRTRGKRKERRFVEYGQAHIRSTFNNTIITMTDKAGNTLSWASAGGLALEDQRRIHRLQLSLLQKLLQKLLWSMVLSQ